MNICIIQPAEAGVTETFLRAHAEYLPAETHVLYGDRPRLAGSPPQPWERRARNRLKLARRLRSRGRRWETSALYLHWLRRLQPDVVLAEYGVWGVRVMTACRAAGSPLVVHFHGFDAWHEPTLQRYRRAYRMLFRRADAVVAVSRAMEQQLRSLGAPPEKLHYNPYGVDCTRFADARPAAAPPVLLAVGRFVEKKAPYLTILAMRQLLRRRPEARLRMIGDGPLLPFCRKLVAQLGLGDAVALLGAQPHERVAQEMRAARAFVQHSRTAPDGDCEGTPLAILEAGAAGLPVVATRHGGIVDVVVEGETGLLVDERDVHGMAAHMGALVANPDLAARLGAAARRRIAAHFSQERSIGRLAAILRACAAPGRRRRARRAA